MKVLLTGANGQLGFSVQKTCPEGIELIALDRNALNLAKPRDMGSQLAMFDVDAVINAAAYTLVDRAEEERELAFSVNAEAVSVLAAYCQEHSIPLIHISTDFIFDGSQSVPYKIDDKPNPLSVYGESKAIGENNALAICKKAYVIRTGWVYCEHGNNFVKTMLRLAAERNNITVVSDQIGTPTYAVHLAEAVWRLLALGPKSRIFHFSDAGVASWYDFAVAVFEQAYNLNLIDNKPEVSPIAGSEYPTPALRPAYSVLDKKSSWDTLGIKPHHWQVGLSKMLNELKS